MIKEKTSSFTHPVLASLFSVLIAYIFGNEGYEAFITIAIALGILITWQLLSLVRLLFRTKLWLVIKLIGLLSLGFIWFVAVVSVMLSVSSNAYNPAASSPSIKWFVVIIGTLPFLLPRLYTYRAGTKAKKVTIGTVTSLYSMIVLYTAAIGFYDTETTYKSVILVLAVQLQYLMNHAVIKTNYLDRSHNFAVNLLKRLSISAHGDTGQYTIIFIVGLPFILPLLVVLFVSSLH